MTVVESPQQYVRPLYQYMEGFDVEDYIDADALRETIARGTRISAEWGRLREGETTREQIERHQNKRMDQIVAIVRAAQADALRKAADDVEPLSEYAAAVVRVHAAEYARKAN